MTFLFKIDAHLLNLLLHFDIINITERNQLGVSAD
jgi:hypothetical protein